MRELTYNEIEKVNGGILANLGLGIVGAAMQMGTYSFAGGASGNLSLGGFVGAATSGFVWGAGGMNHLSFTAGSAAGAFVSSHIDSE